MVLRRIGTAYVDEHGWQKARHTYHPTTDFAVKNSPELSYIVGKYLRSTIIPTLCALYGFTDSEVKLKDLFYVKVRMDQRWLAITRPPSLLLFI